MRPEAVAILQALQPPDEAGRDPLVANFLQTVNKLSNSDKHSQFPTSVPGLRYPVIIRWINADGSEGSFDFPGDTGRLVEDQTEITGLPDGAVDVKVQGTPLVALSIRDQQGYVELPRTFRVGINDFLRPEVVMPLLPYLYV